MEERRTHNRRIDKLEDKFCEHEKKADERWESMEIHIAEMKEIMNKFDGVDGVSLKAIVDIAKGADSISKLAISLSKVIGAFLIIIGGFAALVKFILK